MSIVDLASKAAALVADGKGILAADETPKTLTKRFDALSIPSTPDTRRNYREMLFGALGIARFISGVIMQDETIYQQNSIGTPFADVLSQQGIIPGIKVDTGAKPLAGTTAENITEGLDGLRDRLKDYAQTGARFAKWRAVIHIGDTLPTPGCVLANANALARYAALCQEQGLVAKGCGIDLLEFNQWWSKASAQRAIAEAQLASPGVVEDLIEDAKSKDDVCDRCDGIGSVAAPPGLEGDILSYRLAREASEEHGAIYTRTCPKCAGKGTVRCSGDAHARDRLMEIAGLSAGAKGAAVVIQNFSGASHASAIPMLEDAMNILDVKAERLSPPVRVGESLTVFLDELDLSQVTRHRVRGAHGKRGGGEFFRSPLDLRDLGALGEGLAIAGNTLLVGVDHHGIRKDKSDHVLGVGLTWADGLPVFVSPELGEREPIRHFHRILVLGT
jgi:hypothetical protein